MEGRNRKIIKRIYRVAGSLFLFVIALACIYGVLNYMSVNHGNYKIYDIEDGWTIDYCGHHYDNVSRLDKRPLSIESHKNDVLDMKRKIDVLSPFRITLRLYSRLSSVRVSIIDADGREQVVYFNGYDNRSKSTGEFLGSGYHFIQLPDKCYGKTLRIMEMASQDDALQGIPDMVVTPSSHSMEAFAQARTFCIFITVFMFIAGSIISIISLFSALMDREFFQLTFVGLFSAFGSLWCMCSTKIIEIFSLNIQVNGYIEYMSLYIMLIPLMAMSYGFFKNIPMAYRTVIFILMCLNIALAAAAFVMQILNVANVDYMLPAFHILLAADALLLSLISILHWKKSTLPEKFFEGGIVTAAATGIVYIVYYYFEDRAALDSGAMELIVIPCVFIFMVIMILVGYITDLYARRVDEKQRQRLTVLAYEDELTGLSNRTRGEQEMHRLENEKKPFVFVDFDLNFLKKTNDRYGHSAGDLYIRSFAKILKKSFPDSDYICRMGGDEFLVIYSRIVPDVNELNDKLHMMELYEKAVSGAFPVPVTVDSAYGYAYSTEVKGGKSELVFQTADQRMYNMKMASKKGRAE